MRLMIDCEHGEDDEHWLPGMDPNPLPLDVSDWPSIPEIGARTCSNARTVTGPDAILQALFEAGVLTKVARPTHEFAWRYAELNWRTK